MQEKNCAKNDEWKIVDLLYTFVSNDNGTYIEFLMSPSQIPSLIYYLSFMRQALIDSGDLMFNVVRISQVGNTLRLSSGLLNESSTRDNLLDIMSTLGFDNATQLIASPDLMQTDGYHVPNENLLSLTKDSIALQQNFDLKNARYQFDTLSNQRVVKFEIDPNQIASALFFLSNQRAYLCGMGIQIASHLNISLHNGNVILSNSSSNPDDDLPNILSCMSLMGFNHPTPLIWPIITDSDLRQTMQMQITETQTTKSVLGKRVRTEKKNTPIEDNLAETNKNKKPRATINWSATKCKQGERSNEFVVSNPEFELVSVQTFNKRLVNFCNSLKIGKKIHRMEEPTCFLVTIPEKDFKKLQQERGKFDFSKKLEQQFSKYTTIGNNKKPRSFDALPYSCYEDGIDSIAVITCPVKELSQINASLKNHFNRHFNLEKSVGSVAGKKGNCTILLFLKHPLPAGESLSSCMEKIGFNKARHQKHDKRYFIDSIRMQLDTTPRSKIDLSYYVHFYPISENKVEIQSDLISDTECIKRQINYAYARYTKTPPGKVLMPLRFYREDGKLYCELKMNMALPEQTLIQLLTQLNFRNLSGVSNELEVERESNFGVEESSSSSLEDLSNAALISPALPTLSSAEELIIAGFFGSKLRATNKEMEIDISEINKSHGL